MRELCSSMESVGTGNCCFRSYLHFPCKWSTEQHMLQVEATPSTRRERSNGADCVWLKVNSSCLARESQDKTKAACSWYSSLLRRCCSLLILHPGINCRDANTDCLWGKQEIKKRNKWTVIVWRSACWGDCLNGVRHAENVSISARTNSKPCNN